MYGLYNYGCEAIVRGTYELIKQAWPDCQVILYTFDPECDKSIIEDLNIIVKKIPFKRSKIAIKIANKIFRIFFISKAIELWDANSVADDCDIVFSVGGDIYTIPEHIRKIGRETNNSSIVEFGKTVLNIRPLIIWGASIGPFGDKKKVKDYYFNHLREVNRIFCREERTVEYLKDNNLVSNVEFCADPAFYVEFPFKNNIYNKNEKPRIALNLSPLSIIEQVGENFIQFEKDIINTINNIVHNIDAEIILVPHVVSPYSEEDNDLTYLKKIYNNLPRGLKENVTLLEGAKGFLGTKEVLITCDLVVAARMHCSVNAIAEGVPTIFLTYSQKGVGMANYIYGHSKWAISLLNIEDELPGKVIEMLAEKESISDQIKSRIAEIRGDKNNIIALWKQII